MMYLNKNSAAGAVLVSSGVAIQYTDEMRAWDVDGVLYSDFTGNGYTVSEEPGAAAESLQSVPVSITRAQAKLALLGAGLLDDVQPAIDAITDPTQRAAAQIEWDDRLTFERTNPTLIALANAMGMSSEQLDALFAAGAQL